MPGICPSCGGRTITVVGKIARCDKCTEVVDRGESTRGARLLFIGAALALWLVAVGVVWELAFR